MFLKNKRISIFRYWTSRYLLTLLIGLGIIFFISAVWIRHTTFENRIEMMEFIAEETANRLTYATAPITGPNGIPGFIENRGRFAMRGIDPVLHVVNTEGEILTSNRPIPPDKVKNFKNLLDGEEGTEELIEPKEPIQYVVKRKVEYNQQLMGWVLVVERKDNLTRVNQAYGQLALLISAMAILGWIAIYFLSKRLVRPIKQLSLIHI